MKFDSIISSFAVLLATGVSANYSPYQGGWEVVMMDGNGQTQSPGSMPNYINSGGFPGFPGFPGQGQYPGGQSPGGQYPGGQSPGGQYPGGQSPDDQYQGIQFPSRPSPGGQYPGGQSPGGQYPGGQIPGGEYPESPSTGGQYPGGQSPGGQYPGGQSPGGQYPGSQSPGGQYPGGQNPGGQSPSGQYPGSQNPGGQNPSGQYPGGESPPSEKPSNQYPGGDEKPSPGGNSSGSCANIPAEPGMDIQKMLKLVNEARKGLQPLKLNDSLIKAAVWQSRNQQQMNRVSHDSPDGKGVQARIRECGYPVAVIAENAAPGSSEDDAMKMWLNSPPHKKNIMDPQMKEFGAARAGNYWTQTFGGSGY
ncbi:hypothetical protein CONCODRAFT_13483 [Conidiobolus coronatus NRRL 28638]|uniref:SCP domain-containing protein n=1 Tax=Conidiobolus coronatus (strain ATCC 28846 / CBS 209.66 / NRRL 28638) TaxID=796925 RepID=A0A137NQM2_CONC2|nr:hypothetical protein CONCODRAFT_13483 [Conidiobolus coronatus NRRL 28638]|eukprot:KXN65063.1 hypothetical protein CONCODRAFT_13483 [Conidiobolus coronatus NRRL 28638]